MTRRLFVVDLAPLRLARSVLGRLRSPRARRAGAWALMAAFAAAGAVGLVSLASPMAFHIDAFQVELSIGFFDQGYTRIVLPPVGTIAARTHHPPVVLSLTLVNVDLELLRQMAEESPERERLIERMRERLQDIARAFVLRLMVLAALGGALGVALLGWRNARWILRGAVTGTLLMGLLLFNTYRTYRAEAFVHPEYRGILQAAPWMVGLLEESVVKVQALGHRLKTIARNLDTMFGQLDRLGPLGSFQDGIRILVVSDIHNNPAALDFMSEVIGTFDPAFVIDGGDLTDYGTPVEATLSARLERLGIPYLIAPGNHESSRMIAELEARRNVTVLNGQLVAPAGVPVMGFADPAAWTHSAAVPLPDVYDRLESAIRRAVAASHQRPFILAVHNHRLAGRLAGLAPVIVTGHSHRFSITTSGGSIIVNPGTTGAAGIRALEVQEEVPYSLVLLHVARDAGGHLRPLAADSIRVYNVTSGFTLERTVFPTAPPGPDRPAGR